MYIVFGVILSLVLIFFPVKSSFVYNTSIKMALFSLIIKFFTSFMYLIGFFVILFSGGGAKKENESEYAYQARLRRERASQAFLMMIHHLILVWIINKTTRIGEFSSQTLHMSFNNQHAQLMASASAQNP